MTQNPRPGRRPKRTPGARPPRRIAGHPVTRRAAEQEDPQAAVSEAEDPATTGTSAADAPVDDATTADATTDEATTAEDTSGLDDPDQTAVVPRPTGKTRTVARVSTLKPGSGTTPRSRPAPAPTSTRQRWEPTGRLLLGLLGAAVVLAVVAVVLAFTPGADVGDNRAYVDQAATDQVAAQASSKICTAIAVDSADLDEWAERARAVLTGPALEEFDEFLPAQRELLGQTQAVADCRVDVLGVKSLTEDNRRAVVIANLIVSENQQGFVTGSATTSVQFDLEKQGDQWFISEVLA